MDFDYYELYQDYTNAELLAILQESHGYRQEALDAARKLLQERDGVDVAIPDVEHNPNPAFDNEAAIPATFKEKLIDFLEPVLHPGNPIDPVKWLNILVLVFALQYVAVLLPSVQYVYFHFISNEYKIVKPYSQLFALLYMPVMYILLLKQQKWGWIIFVSAMILGIVTTIFWTFYGLVKESAALNTIIEGLANGLIRLMIILFMYSREIMERFEITSKNKEYTLLAAIAFAILFNIANAMAT